MDEQVGLRIFEFKLGLSVIVDGDFRLRLERNNIFVLKQEERIEARRGETRRRLFARVCSLESRICLAGKVPLCIAAAGEALIDAAAGRPGRFNLQGGGAGFGVPLIDVFRRGLIIRTSK